MKWEIPFFELSMGKEESEAVVAVLESNWLTTGPCIDLFEQKFANKLGVSSENVVALSSATAALHLSLVALNIGPGDEVLVPALTFVACANVIRSVGATPVFVDIESSDSWLISVVDVEKKISDKTRAIIAVHYAGFACDMDELTSVADANGIEIIEDCSHAQFVEHNGAMLGTLGFSGCFSFFSNKNMTTGEGGMFVASDASIARRVRTLRSHGISASTYQRFKGHASGYDVIEVGYNYRMDEIRASIGLAQLDKFESFQLLRREKYDNYLRILDSTGNVLSVPFRNYRGHSALHIFPVLIPEGFDRDIVIDKMKADRIQCSFHYTPINRFTAYKVFHSEVKETESIAPYILSLPFFPTISLEQQEAVVNKLMAILE